MTTKKLIIAAALLLAGTGASLAQGMNGPGVGYQRAFGHAYHHSRGYHDPSFVGGGLYNYAPGFAGPQNYSGTASGQPSPSSGIEAERG
jgi:hypothetical protein